jgi:hypothetical protein
MYTNRVKTPARVGFLLTVANADQYPFRASDHITKAVSEINLFRIQSFIQIFDEFLLRPGLQRVSLQSNLGGSPHISTRDIAPRHGSRMVHDASLLLQRGWVVMLSIFRANRPSSDVLLFANKQTSQRAMQRCTKNTAKTPGSRLNATIRARIQSSGFIPRRSKKLQGNCAVQSTPTLAMWRFRSKNDR